MALTAEQLAARENKLTASRVGTLVTGSEEDIYSLWREMTGDPTYDAIIEADRKSLDEKWEIRRGNALEGPVLNWYEFEKQQKISKRGEIIIHPDYNWVACTLDGWVEDMDYPIEVKVNYSGKKFLEVSAHYFPQQHWAMFANSRKRCAFGVSLYGHKPFFSVTEFDENYWSQLWQRAQAFWHCVENLIVPVQLPPVQEVVLPENYRTICMDGSNGWAMAAADWLANRESARMFETSKDSLKALMERDVGHAYGYGIHGKRNIKGAVTFREGDGL